MEPRHGRYTSEVLGLELHLEGGMLRFWAGNALLLEPEEMNERLRGLLDEEARRREEAERRLAELQRELERLKPRRD